MAANATGPDPKCADPEFVEKFLALVADGLQPYLACEACGVSRITFYKWWRLGGGASVSDNADFVQPEDALDPYKSFVARTLAVEAGLLAEINRTVTQKSKTDAEFALKVLRSRYPEDWGSTRKQSTTVVVSDAAPAVQMTAAEYMKTRQLMRAEDHAASEGE